MTCTAERERTPRCSPVVINKKKFSGAWGQKMTATGRSHRNFTNKIITLNILLIK